jgi:hypothetical protein
MAVMALALVGLSMPARAEDVIRLFAPVPAGKIVLRPLPTAQAPPRALVARAAPVIRGSLRDGEPAAPSVTPAAKAPWLVAPQITSGSSRTTETPSLPADDWQTVPPPPRVIRNAAR